MVRLFTILAVLSFAISSYGGTTEYSGSDLVGVWRLIHTEDPMPNGTVVPYCNGVHGYIIYTPNGHVSVALNCGTRANKFEPADVSGRMYFYTGTYQVNGNTVTHYIENASDTQLIGKSVTRTIGLNGYMLELSGLSQGQKFSATWQNTDADIAVAIPPFGQAASADVTCDVNGRAYKIAKQYLARQTGNSVTSVQMLYRLITCFPDGGYVDQPNINFYFGSQTVECLIAVNPDSDASGCCEKVIGGHYHPINSCRD